MNKLQSLNRNILDLTHDEVLDRIRSIREDRQVSKKAITKKVAQKEKREVNMVQKAASMSPEELAELIKMLEEAEKDG